MGTLTQAARLLQTENISITEAGLRAGFENPSYFIKLFKAQSHMTPAEYKKLYY
ncbi:helix-turn-helix domain-containing protein [uncultured Robinsoniella sp.]|uniref:helix-turn-helix domain-containing protein n=1 Tax=uncultured Robinsoniella sp. TaxID=904190 RepID=UPI00374F2D1C